MPKKHSGGRPVKPIKRDHHLMVRLTSTEHFLIGIKAKEAGMKPSEWFRQSAKRARVIPRLSPEDQRHMHMLAGLANNLNQIAKRAHTDGFLTLHTECKELIKQVDAVLKKFWKDDREDN